MGKEVTIYSTPFCHFCHVAKDYFTENGIAFTEVNVAEDQTRLQEMIQKSGQMGVPVIEIGSEVMVGFNRPVLSELLAR